MWSLLWSRELREHNNPGELSPGLQDSLDLILIQQSHLLIIINQLNSPQTPVKKKGPSHNIKKKNMDWIMKMIKSDLKDIQDLPLD